MNSSTDVFRKYYYILSVDKTIISFSIFNIFGINYSGNQSREAFKIQSSYNVSKPEYIM